jgi:cysteine-rich repeat protein
VPTCGGTLSPPTNNFCRLDCTYCGDGIRQAGEDCDDGNAVNGDGCETNCRLSPTCGDGTIQTPETCDPPLAPAPAGPNRCRQGCTYCGDGIVQPVVEECDDGPANSNTQPTACLTDCTLPATIFLPTVGELCISEVVTDPQRNWSDSNGIAGSPFDWTPAPGPAGDGDEYVEIRNVGSRTLSLVSLVLFMTDATPESRLIGNPAGAAFYSDGASPFSFPPGATVVIGDPPGEMDSEIFLELAYPGLGTVGELEVGGNFRSNNFGADDDRDGQVDEDWRDGLDNDGDGAYDEDGTDPMYFRNDPVRDGAPGPGLDGDATGIADEALQRIANHETDFRDFERGRGDPGRAPDIDSFLTIDEVVTNPQSDWSGGSPFDINPGPGAPNADDEYIEIRNRSGGMVSIRNLVLRMIDATPESYRIGSLVGGTVERYSNSGSADEFKDGEILVIGNPPGEMSDAVFIELAVPCGGTLADLEIGDAVAAQNFESDDDRDGRIDEDYIDNFDNDNDGAVDEDGTGPDPIGDGARSGPVTGASDEASVRLTGGNNDLLAFGRGPGSPGLPTGP